MKGDPRTIKAAHDAIALASGHGAPVREKVRPGRGGEGREGKACSSEGRAARCAMPAISSAKFGWMGARYIGVYRCVDGDCYGTDAVVLRYIQRYLEVA